jgi:hypothetical protein
VGIGGIREKTRGIEDVHLVNAIRQYLLLDAVKSGACADTFQLHAELVGELATLGQQFKANLCNGIAFKLTIYKYIIHVVSGF